MLNVTIASSDAASISSDAYTPEHLLNKSEGPLIIKTDPGSSATQILKQIQDAHSLQDTSIRGLSDVGRCKFAAYLADKDVAEGKVATTIYFSGGDRKTIEWVKSGVTALADESEDVESLKAKENFKSELMSALRAEHIEDGMSHPAEDIVQSAFDRSPEIAGQWIQSLFVDNYYKRPAIAGAILRLLGRLPYSLVGFTGTLLSVAGLIHQEVQIRDSAVRALESWGGSSSQVVLENHLDREPAPRLARYIKQVIKDLSD